MKNWVIKKLGGFTLKELNNAVGSATERAKEQLRTELNTIPITVRGDCPDISGALEWQKDFVNKMCEVLRVEKLW